jgi:hypothetical protein
VTSTHKRAINVYQRRRRKTHLFTQVRGRLREQILSTLQERTHKTMETYDQIYVISSPIVIHASQARKASAATAIRMRRSVKLQCQGGSFSNAPLAYWTVLICPVSSAASSMTRACTPVEDRPTNGSMVYVGSRLDA